MYIYIFIYAVGICKCIWIYIYIVSSLIDFLSSLPLFLSISLYPFSLSIYLSALFFLSLHLFSLLFFSLVLFLNRSLLPITSIMIAITITIALGVWVQWVSVSAGVSASVAWCVIRVPIVQMRSDPSLMTNLDCMLCFALFCLLLLLLLPLLLALLLLLLFIIMVVVIMIIMYKYYHLHCVFRAHK